MRVVVAFVVGVKFRAKHLPGHPKHDVDARTNRFETSVELPVSGADDVIREIGTWTSMQE